eukprot:6182931-Pleurochrysis_carterae.AAC.1
MRVLTSSEDVVAAVGMGVAAGLATLVPVRLLGPPSLAMLTSMNGPWQQLWTTLAKGLWMLIRQTFKTVSVQDLYRRMRLARKRIRTWQGHAAARAVGAGDSHKFHLLQFMLACANSYGHFLKKSKRQVLAGRRKLRAKLQPTVVAVAI